MIEIKFGIKLDETTAVVHLYDHKTGKEVFVSQEGSLNFALSCLENTSTVNPAN